MYYVYILKSLSQSGAIYKGFTRDLEKRLRQHNDPENQGYTRVYAPWAIEFYAVFSSCQEAEDFERYLKSSSGNAFMRKRLLSEEFKKELEKFNNGKIKEISET